MPRFKRTPFEEFLSGFHPSDQEVLVHAARNTWSKVWHDGRLTEEVVNSVLENSNGLTDGRIDVPDMYLWVTKVFNPLFEAGGQLFLYLKELRIEGENTVIPIDVSRDDYGMWHDLVSICNKLPDASIVMVFGVADT